MPNLPKPRLPKEQRIRLTNSTWAAGGGVLLSFVAYYSSQAGLYLGDPITLIWVLVAFWLGNFGFIGAIFLGFNKRFADPALSLPQMYWAMCTTNIALTFTLQLDTLYYLLIMLTMVFGVFRVTIRQFNFFCYFAICLLLISHTTRYTLYPIEDLGTAIISWSAFAFCAITLTSLCKSIVKLRSRLRQKNSELKEAVQAKSDFLANMSHEIRTPMNGVIGMLDVALISEKNPDQARYLSVARESAYSLLAIINDILDFSKFESGAHELESIKTDVSELINQVLVNFSGVAEKNNIELISDISPTLSHHVLCDPSRLKQILNNLVGNALKFTHQGEIVVKARGEKLGDGVYQLHVMVRDTGIGIPAEKQKKLFESFTQADTSTTREYGGTGLGLAIAKQLCESMNGRISLESYEGKGSTFSFYIEVKKTNIPTEVPTIPDYIRDFRVLLVDDNAACRNVITKYLEYLELQVVAVESAKQALLRIENSAHFDTVIIDRQMPGMTGETLARQIRLQTMDDAIPIIMLSTIHASNSQKLIQDLQLTAFLTKPVRNTDLYNALGLTFQSTCFIPELSQGNETPQNSDNIEAETSAPTTEQPPAPSTDRAGKLLLVDDNKTNQEVAVLTLEVLGYEADVANDGLEAIQMLKRSIDNASTYRAIIMDCQMPRMDGFQATRAIRTNPELATFKYIPIIAMTANARDEVREECLAAGMNDYLSKPIESATLKSTLAHWLNEPSEPKAEPVIENAPENKKDDNHTDIWNRQGLEQLVGNNPARAVKLISSFVTSLLSMRLEIEENLENKHYESVKSTIHGLKGAAANIRVDRLATSAADLERALKDNKEADIRTSYKHFSLELEIAVSHLSEYLECTDTDQ